MVRPPMEVPRPEPCRIAMDKNEINDKGHIAGFDFEEHELILADGFEDCVVGIVTGFGESPKVCYDRGAMIEELMSGGMSEEDAEEYFGFNVEGAYVGSGTPCFLYVDEELFQRLRRPDGQEARPDPTERDAPECLEAYSRGENLLPAPGRISLRSEPDQGRHRPMTVFVNGQNCGRLMFADDEDFWFSEALRRGLKDLSPPGVPPIEFSHGRSSMPDPPRRDYAKVVWRVEDVTDLAPEMTEDEARDFLERNERHIAGRICEVGYQVIEDYLGYEALESGGADEEPGSGGEGEG
jgi:hypothetical protein